MEAAGVGNEADVIVLVLADGNAYAFNVLVRQEGDAEAVDVVGLDGDGGLELHSSVLCIAAGRGHAYGVDVALLHLVELLPGVCAACAVAALAVEEQSARPGLLVAHLQDEILCRGKGYGAC